MEASIQGQIAVPPHTNRLSFLIFFICAVIVCQQKWAGMDGFALRVGGGVKQRGKRGADIDGYSLLGLDFDSFVIAVPLIPPFFLCSLCFHLSGAICFWAQTRLFVVAEMPALQTS